MKKLKQSVAAAVRRCVHGLVVRYLGWRLKGAYALKPPLGWHPDFGHPRFNRRLSYAVKYWWWREESLLWENHGEELRQRWQKSFEHNTGAQAR
jgi:hypothetical protein